MPIYTKTASGWVEIEGGGSGGPSDAAKIITPPAKTNGDHDVVTYTVKTTAGETKKLYCMLGNTSTNPAPTSADIKELTTEELVDIMLYRTEPAVFTITLSAGMLPGVMVASGGPGGYNNAVSAYYGGGGGAGGVVGLGCNVPVFLNQAGDATYEITVGGTSVSDNVNHLVMYGQSTSIAAQGGVAFMAAVGGGGGFTARGGQFVAPYNGGSGGGGFGQDNSEGVSTNYGRPGDGVPGQGHPGGVCVNPYSGGGGGYSGPGNVPLGSGGPFNVSGAAGGPGMSVTAALGLDESDAGVQAFMAACTANGMIAGGGSSSTNDSIDGGGARGQAAQDWTGGGGGGSPGQGNGANGAAGAVYLLGDE